MYRRQDLGRRGLDVFRPAAVPVEISYLVGKNNTRRFHPTR